jgi:hypothetical protein
MLMTYYYIHFPNVQEILRHHADAGPWAKIVAQ